MNEEQNLETNETEINNTEIIEPCAEINTINNDLAEISRSLDEIGRDISTTVAQAPGCSTAVLRGLSVQIIDEMNRITPNCLVSFADLNVSFEKEGAVNPFLQQAAKESLKKIINERGKTLVVNSAYRTLAQQFMIYNRYKNGKCFPLAAPPGRSNHEDGLALDIDDSDGWRSFFIKHGWVWQGPKDPVHYSYKGRGTRGDISNIAIKAFQLLWNRNNPGDKIAEDGDVGPATLARLSKSPIKGFGATPSSASTPPAATRRILRLSQPYMEGDDVRKVQQALVKANISITVDGIFGPGTVSAVKRFQQQNNLTADGVVGPATLLELGL